ncbi:MAG: type II toxin-antitoxin system HipA family toxin [Gammaproteobacteria bacterium]|nr:type II toxin-antitoxin system HipA family toxin [Gammaproteobacteria bacterium]
MSDRAFVHAHVPGAALPALVGQVIVIATGNDGFCRFKYAPEWLGAEHAFALDPEALPLENTVFDSPPGWEVFGAMRDAAPDHWGRKLIERSQNRLGLSELEFLLAAGDERTGALGFSTGREASVGSPAPSVTLLERLVEAAARVERDEPVDVDLLRLLWAGTGTLGGMRPKTTVESGGALWVAKFPSREDRYAITRWEFGALRLAGRCGLRVPEHRLETVGTHPVLLTARFDRRARGGIRERAHYLSGLTMLGLHERDYGSGGYADLALWLRRHGAEPAEDVRELFRRMAFNVLIGNTDDHLRNHAVIDFGEGYRLSPAFDVMPWPASGGERVQALGVGRQGRLASIENVLSDAQQFGLKPDAAAAELTRLQAVIQRDWRDAFRNAGVAARELALVERVISPYTPSRG